EDGIRAFHVTGVQTCALPISGAVPAHRVRALGVAAAVPRGGSVPRHRPVPDRSVSVAYSKQTWTNGPDGGTPLSAARLNHIEDEIGRAACRGRVDTPCAEQSE